MRAFSLFNLGLAAIALLGLAARAAAEGGCCAHCGCQASCQKVCRLVCEEKKVPITCFGCKCEDFCIPGHSKTGCQHCETVCDEDAVDCDAPCTHSKNFVWTEWMPGCAKLHTKKKLMKKTITKKVPTYKWVVEDLCGPCQVRAAAAPESGQVAPASFTSDYEAPWYKSLLPAWNK